MTNRVLSIILVVTMTAGMLAACRNNNENVVGADLMQNGDNIVIVDIPLTEEAYGIGVDKDNPELLEAINGFIERSMKDGTFDTITSHYFEADQEPVAIQSGKLDYNKDQFIVATTGDFEPFDYDEGEDHYGIDKEFIQAIADYLGKELVLVNVNFDIIFMTVFQKKCDACIAGITIKPEREQYVTFTEPYYHAAQSIAVRTDNNEFADAKTKEDVEKILLNIDAAKTIAVEGGTSGEDYLRGRDSGGFPGVNCNVNSVVTLSEALVELSNGEVDYVIGDAACLKYMISHQYNYFSKEN